MVQSQSELNKKTLTTLFFLYMTRNLKCQKCYLCIHTAIVKSQLFVCIAKNLVRGFGSVYIQGVLYPDRSLYLETGRAYVQIGAYIYGLYPTRSLYLGGAYIQIGASFQGLYIQLGAYIRGMANIQTGALSEGPYIQIWAYIQGDLYADSILHLGEIIYPGGVILEGMCLGVLQVE